MVRRRKPASSRTRSRHIPAISFLPEARADAVTLRADKVPFVASDVGKYSDVAVGFDARRGEELHARRYHPRIRGVEVLDLEEETHPPGGLLPDGGGLLVSVSPGEQHAGRGTGRPDYDPPLGPPIVGQGRGVLRKLEAQPVHEETDSRVILADHDGNEAQMHGASIGDRSYRRVMMSG